MAIIDAQKYISRVTSGGRNAKRVYRNWWLIPYTSYGRERIKMVINIPKEYIGKKIRFKLEVIEDGEDNGNNEQS